MPNKYYIPRARKIMPNPIYWNALSQTSTDQQNLHNTTINNYWVSFDKGDYICYLILEEHNKSERIVSKKIWNEDDYLEKNYEQQKEAAASVNNLIREIVNADLTNYSWDSLKKLAFDVQKKWINYDQLNVYPWFIGADLFQQKLSSKLLEINPHILNLEIDLLSSPIKCSFVQREELEILESALEVQNKFCDINELSEALSKKWGWIGFGYDGPEIFLPEYYKNEILKYNQLFSTELEAKIKNLTGYSKNIETQQNELIQKYNIPLELVKQITKLQHLGFITDERKETHFPLHAVYKKVLISISKQIGISVDDLKTVSLEEIFEKSKAQLQVLISMRKQKMTVFYFTNGNYTDLDDQQVDEFLADVNKDFVSSEIKGSVASKTGVEKIVGKARVLKSANEVGNMQQGEILVTSMTSPDFVPAMRKAICIITDEGGVTCHAAIVSRELKIPCIIGTRVATQVLKDGDLVEVDTINGVVKILEKAKE